MSVRGGDRRDGTTKDEWLTPPEIVAALGPFDLDPCAPADGRRPWGTAATHYSEQQDGLSQPWFGMVWCNPPYGSELYQWLERLAGHGQGIALTFARTETAGFHAQVWRRAHALAFLKGRLRFHHVDGTRAPAAPAPSVLIAYGTAATARLRRATTTGPINAVFVPLRDGALAA